MEHIKKRLVFYFYTFEDFLNNRAIKIHLKCLKHYAHVFDEALFIISVDEIDNSKLIFETESELLKIGFKDVHFKVHKNNGYCEAQPFFEEIVSKLDNLDGLTFFGHTKGVTNYQKTDCCLESIDAWLLGMYYLNLEFIDEMESSVCYNINRCYGAFLTENKHSGGTDWLYAGTFYWLNCPSIYIDGQRGCVEIPKTFHQRGFAEDFPGLLYKLEELGSHGNIILYPFDIYSKAHTAIPILLGDGDSLDRYEIFKKEILCQIT